MRTVDLRDTRDVSVQQIGVNRGIQILTGNKSNVYSGSEHSRSRSTGGTGKGSYENVNQPNFRGYYTVDNAYTQEQDHSPGS